jgi:hypothetical protein
MKTVKPNMCKTDGPLTICRCDGGNIKEKERNCHTYVHGKRGYCEYYRSTLNACSNYDEYYSKED